MSAQSLAAVSEDSVLNQDTVQPEASDAFVCTPAVEELTERASAYLQAGYPVHLAGPAGTGKTTLAFHAAAKRGRPVKLIHGNDEFGVSDLVGQDNGYRRNTVVDNFIHSVVKTQEEVRTFWIDNRVTTACLNGETLIYDEFNRSRPEVNNLFLSILGEGILNLPNRRHQGAGYLQVHPEFRVIFTSNPEEYAGTHKTQDALRDRMITMKIDHYDRETEIRVTHAKSGLPLSEVAIVVDIVRELREQSVNHHRPTLRASIAIARIMQDRKITARSNNSFFRAICRDILDMEIAKVRRDGAALVESPVDDVVARISSRARRPKIVGQEV
ncbi:MAG: gas vesicle protein GvpN [Sphingobacteriia bacterium]|nr:gas vesicle protein GvpN [Sphingobacteriia bacterium]NCC39100.1 gas vesicle protein GvpN [Gammaproteobacteria bacterium]